jgi:hypothetical protein
MARDSGVVEEDADFILGLYQVESEARVIVGDDSSQYDLVCKILKTAKGLATRNGGSISIRQHFS